VFRIALYAWYVVAEIIIDVSTATLTYYNATKQRVNTSFNKTASMSDTQLKKRKMSPAEDKQQTPLAPVSQLLVKRVSDKGKLPTRGSPLSAGYDLYRYVSNDPHYTWSCYNVLPFVVAVLSRLLFLRVERLLLIRKYRSLCLQALTVV
jgi:hypothetical protein